MRVFSARDGRSSPTRTALPSFFSRKHLYGKRIKQEAVKQKISPLLSGSTRAAADGRCWRPGSVCPLYRRGQEHRTDPARPAPRISRCPLPLTAEGRCPGQKESSSPEGVLLPGPWLGGRWPIDVLEDQVEGAGVAVGLEAGGLWQDQERGTGGKEQQQQAEAGQQRSAQQGGSSGQLLGSAGDPERWGRAGAGGARGRTRQPGREAKAGWSRQLLPYSKSQQADLRTEQGAAPPSQS